MSYLLSCKIFEFFCWKGWVVGFCDFKFIGGWDLGWEIFLVKRRSYSLFLGRRVVLFWFRYIYCVGARLGRRRLFLGKFIR